MDIALDKLEKYAAKKILPRLDSEGRRFELTPTELGNRNHIFFLEIPGRGSFILKGFRDKDRIKNTLLANRFLSRINIPVPKTFFSDTSKKTFSRFGCYFSCEEKIEGKTLADTDDFSDSIGRIASFYANMHRITSSRWGRFTSGKKYGYTRKLMKKVDKRLKALQETASLLAAPDAQRYRQWFDTNKEKTKEIKVFSLCHGDVNARNILLSDNGDMYILDNEAIKYQPYPLEYYRLAFFLFGDNPSARKAFEKAYFEELPPEKRRCFDACDDFYRAYVLLEIAWYCNKKVKKHNTPDALKTAYTTTRTGALDDLKTLIP